VKNSQPRRLGQVDPEPIAFPLIAAGHFGAGVAEMALDMRFLDFRGAGEAGAQRMAGKRQLSFALAEIAANAGGQRGFLHQPRDMLVGQALRGDARVFLGDTAKQRPVGDSTKPHPGFEHRDGAGEGAGAASDLDLAPAGLAVDGEQQTAFIRGSRNIGASFVFSAAGVPAFVFCRARPVGGAKDFNPAGSVFALVRAAVEADDFRAAEAAGETDCQNGGRLREGAESYAKPGTRFP